MFAYMQGLRSAYDLKGANVVVGSGVAGVTMDAAWSRVLVSAVGLPIDARPIHCSRVWSGADAKGGIL